MSEPGRTPSPDDAHCYHCGKRLSDPDESHDDHAASGRGDSPCLDARDHRFSVQQAFLAGICTTLAVLSLLALAGVL